MAKPRRTISADPGDLKGVRILLVESRFYDDIADELLKGAMRALDAAGAIVARLTGVAPAEAAVADAVDDVLKR